MAPFHTSDELQHSITVPPGLPEFGQYEGEPIRLADLPTELDRSAWPSVSVVVDGEVLYPFRGTILALDDDDNVVI